MEDFSKFYFLQGVLVEDRIPEEQWQDACVAFILTGVLTVFSLLDQETSWLCPAVTVSWQSSYASLTPPAMPHTGPWKTVPWPRLASFHWITTAGSDVWMQSLTSGTALCCTASVTGAWRDRSTAYAFSGPFTPAWQMVRWSYINLQGTSKAYPHSLGENRHESPFPSTVSNCSVTISPSKENSLLLCLISRENWSGMGPTLQIHQQT